jgi:hypothetical protein
MQYLIVDASLNGTGIRDVYNGGYIDPRGLDLNHNLICKISKWKKRYEKEFYNNYTNVGYIDSLDNEGIEIAKAIQQELKEAKIEYFSDAMMKKIFF